MKKCILLTISVFGALFLILPGCSQVKEASDATISFFRGDLVIDEVYSSMDKCYLASLAAFDQLGIKTTEKIKTPLKSTITGRDSYDEKIDITLERLTSESTKMIIHAGVMGNEDKSWAIFDQIKENL